MTTWEVINDGERDRTERLRIDGGWLYRTAWTARMKIGRKGHGVQAHDIHETMQASGVTFVPDPPAAEKEEWADCDHCGEPLDQFNDCSTWQCAGNSETPSL